MVARALAGVVALAAAAAVLAGCGGWGGAGVRDFGAVEVGKTVVQVAPTGARRSCASSTDPPTICAIAYGPTAALGSIANDPGMGGTRDRPSTPSCWAA